MKKIIQKVISSLVLSLGLSVVTQPTLSAHSRDTIELATAFLRGPAAYLEYELRNDTSRSAHLKRVMIHAIRLLNDLCAHKGIMQVDDQVITLDIPTIPSCYDAIQIISNVYNARKNNQQESHILPNKELQILRQFILPAIEMLGALVRSGNVISRIPIENAHAKYLANRTIDISRYAQLFCASDKNSKARRAWGVLLVWTILQFSSFSAYLIHNAHERNQRIDGIRNNALLHIQHNQPERLYVTGSECSICTNAYDNPQALNCGHIFCRKCLLQWFGYHAPTCPNCRKRVTDMAPIAANRLNQEIAAAEPGKQ